MRSATGSRNSSQGSKSGKITRFDEGAPGQVVIETATQRLDRLKRRVAELNNRLGTNSTKHD